MTSEAHIAAQILGVSAFTWTCLALRLKLRLALAKQAWRHIVMLISTARNQMVMAG